MPNGLQKLVVTAVTGENLCSFKNRKRVTPSGGLMTDRKVKARMDRLEDSIVSALYSFFQTSGDEMVTDFRKQWRMRLCGLSDDSLAVVPEFSFGVEYVEKGQEGVRIEIEEIL